MKKFYESRPQQIIEGLCLALLAGMILLPILFWSRLPDPFPGHFNGAGEIDRWGAKWEIFLLPGTSVFMYLLLTFACGLLLPSIKKGELPPSAFHWLSALKPMVLALFAFIEGYQAAARTMPGWVEPAVLAAMGVVIVGFLVSAICFQAKRSGS